MIIKLTIEMCPRKNRQHAYSPDEYVADEYEKKHLTLLGLEGYVRDLVKRFQIGAGSLSFNVRVTGPHKKE